MWAALHGDFGIPFQSPTETVGELIARTWPVSIKLGLVALGFAIPIGLLLGILAAARQNTWIDYLDFVRLHLGIGGAELCDCRLAVSALVGAVQAVANRWLGNWYNYIMPAIALGLAPMALTARYTRTSILEVSRSDFIRTARSKGLSETQVMLRHTMKNALIPLITILGPQIPNVITGTIFVESVFRVPGFGKFFVTSIFRRDYPMIMATLLLVAVVWSLVYLASDILYTVVDPRVRLDKKES